MSAEEALTAEAEVLLDVRRDRTAVRVDPGQMGPGDLPDLRRLGPGRLTCARTGTARGPACLARLGQSCACSGWTT